jgi:hypothetical protein
MAAESEHGNCDAWAATDPSGVPSPYKFNRRWLGFTPPRLLKSSASFLSLVWNSEYCSLLGMLELYCFHAFTCPLSSCLVFSVFSAYF